MCAVGMLPLLQPVLSSRNAGAERDGSVLLVKMTEHYKRSRTDAVQSGLLVPLVDLLKNGITQEVGP